MFHILCRMQPPHFYIRDAIPHTTRIYNLGFLVHLQSSHLTTFSTTPSPTTVEYLINSCGLDPKTALLASKKVHLKNTEKPDKVLNMLRSYGITDTILVRIISINPRVLKSDPDKIIKPKMEFLSSLGVSGFELTKILEKNVNFLGRSLENQIIPVSNFLKTMISSHEDFVHLLGPASKYFNCYFEQNIATLRSSGVSEPNILRILSFYPKTCARKTDQFKIIVEAVKKMGFCPLSKSFCYAVRTMGGLNESSWEARWEAYKKLGFHEEEILSIFKKEPHCLMSSEEKIRKSVDFYTQKLKWKLSDICVCPMLMRLSLEKRIIPRCNVLELLNSNGIMKNTDVKSLGVVLKLTEEDFFEKFVVRNQQAVPELVTAYEGSICLEDMQA